MMQVVLHFLILTCLVLVEEKSYVTTGSGSPVAYGLLEEEYREDLTVEEAKKIALRAVKAAIVRNIGTGDGINIAIMDKDGFRLLTDEQKESSHRTLVI